MKLRWSSFRCSFEGIAYFIKTETHARWHLLASVVVVVLGIVTSVDRLEWLALVAAMGFVWTAEALNTAIELACDAITKEQNPLIGRAKDVASGAVSIAAFFAIVVAVLVFGPKLMK